MKKKVSKQAGQCGPYDPSTGHTASDVGACAKG